MKPEWMLPPIEELTELPLVGIACNLAEIKRFAGGLKWSVLHHTLLVADLCNFPHSVWARLHDAHEAWDGDTTKPAKQALGIAWENFEAMRAVQIARLAGITISDAEFAAVKEADNKAAEIELRMSQHGSIAIGNDPEGYAAKVDAIRLLSDADRIAIWVDDVKSLLRMACFTQSATEANAKHQVTA